MMRERRLEVLVVGVSSSIATGTSTESGESASRVAVTFDAGVVVEQYLGTCSLDDVD